jgi:hypothetical protein
MLLVNNNSNPTKYMIIDFSVSIKTYKKNILNNYCIINYQCPSCGSYHCFSRHSTYLRNITTFNKNILSNEKIDILRIICSSCKKTHAILPNDVVPYCIYSYLTIMRILTEHFIDKERVLSLVNKYNISFQIIYFFISKLKTFLNDCIFVLRTITLLESQFNSSIKNILNILNDKSINKSFQRIFHNKTKWMILMKKFLNIRPIPISIGSCNN